MKRILRNILAVLLGLIVGMGIMMLLHTLFASIVPLPEGVDFSKPESFKENIDKFTGLHFFTASLAHGLGTLSAAFIACKISLAKNRTFILVASLFLIFGILNARDLNPPILFTLLDLSLAYFPMAWIGKKLAGVKSWFPPKN